ncbi:penicillin-binding protein [Deltaproteobacteria bacterium Smac51]|nr:penicillin-binding protein [Deltaproteobacteria bacterium Smac51]
MTDRKDNHDDFDFDLAGPAAWDEPEQQPVRRKALKEKQPPAERAKKSPKKTGKPAPQTGGAFRRFMIGLFWTALGCGLAGLVALFAIYTYFAQDLPSTAGLKNYAPPTVTYFYSDDGRVIGEYSHERRFVVPLAEIPDTVRNAFLAVEDANFYNHLGVNPKAVIRAALANFKSGDNTQGASTITQQVVRSFLLTPEKSYRRKIREMILAFRIEGNLTKDEILYLYLNQIYLGRGAYGVEAAARTYYDKNVSALSIAEAAMLAGITQAPNNNPVNTPDIARRRQLHGINRMLTVGFITEQQAAAARAEVVHIRGEWPNPNTEVTPYFTEHVRRLLVDQFGEDSLYNDGWKVYTTVNIEAQRAADAAVARGLWEYARRRGFKGPIKHLDLEEQIAAFIASAEKELPPEGLIPARLYQAVITEVDAKNTALSVRVGPYSGKIVKKNLAWAAKGAINKQFQRGDVIWVRLDEQPKADDKKTAENETSGLAIDLSAIIANQENSLQTYDMILEQRTDVQSALFSMEAETGDVKAMVGGRDFGESQFNRAVQSQRQPGSSFKPILYTSAMDHGFTPGSVMNDAPLVIDDKGSGRRWKPVNSDLKFRGPMSLYSALISSRNLISIKILDRIGFEALQQTAENMGITEKLPQSLTVALGSHGIHMPELVTAYSTFPNMGVRVKPRYITRIEDRYGRVVATFESDKAQAVEPGTACAVTWMLRGVVAQGTGTVVKPLNRPVGGKTGTTNDYSDAWFIGFTPEMVTAVWMGTDQQRPRAVGEVGGKAVGPIFLYYMREVLKDLPIKEFIVPPDAQIAPGGAFGICYKAGTVGTGISETITTSNPTDDFLRGDFEDGAGLGVTGADYESDFNHLPEGETLGGGGD